MTTKCTVYFQKSGGPLVINDLDTITTDYGVLDIVHSTNMSDGPKRVIFAPGVWTNVELEMVD
jgi:hypothetical protein